MRNKVWVIRVMSFRRSGMDPGRTTESHDPEIGFAVPWKSEGVSSPTFWRQSRCVEEATSSRTFQMLLRLTGRIVKHPLASSSSAGTACECMMEDDVEIKKRSVQHQSGTMPICGVATPQNPPCDISRQPLHTRSI